MLATLKCMCTMARDSCPVFAGDLFDGSLLLPDTGAEMWEVDRGSDPKLMVLWGDDEDMFDPQTQVGAAGPLGAPWIGTAICIYISRSAVGQPLHCWPHCRRLRGPSDVGGGRGRLWLMGCRR